MVNADDQINLGEKEEEEDENSDDEGPVNMFGNQIKIPESMKNSP